MRKLIGCLLLIAGVGGLGYVGAMQNAAGIQFAIAAAARGSVENIAIFSANTGHWA